MKKYCYLIAVLSILLSLNIHSASIYKNLSGDLLWASDSLYLNVLANREQWRACKKFRWCDEYHTPPKWEVFWTGEVTWTV